MQVSNSPKLLEKLLGGRPVRLVLGNFDGVHVGHRRLISEIVAKCEAGAEASLVVTFDPHPAVFFGRGGDFRKIDTSDIRRSILQSLGVSGLLELKFDNDLAGLTGERFIQDILGAFTVREVSVGRDFRFGRDRSGTVELLAEHGRRRGFEVSLMNAVTIDGAVASSSSIREMLARDGAVERAAKFLSRPFSLRGVVVKGDQIGRTLGFPTANVGQIQQILPKDGVYSGYLRVVSSAAAGELSNENVLPCVVNVGLRPTVKPGERERRVEAHVYDTKGLDMDLYAKEVDLRFIRRLRDEIRFESLDQLKHQISKDIENARTSENFGY